MAISRIAFDFSLLLLASVFALTREAFGNQPELKFALARLNMQKQD
ncbi:MAG: hypothetical protein JW732_08005 [Dehalococcoidia bacterium]|nr:hypothetical protein [Dehalococcoidia bacterium]